MKSTTLMASILTLSMLVIAPIGSATSRECHVNDLVEVVCAEAEAWADYDSVNDDWDLHARGTHYSAFALSLWGELAVVSASTSFGGTDRCIGAPGTLYCSTSLSGYGHTSWPPGDLCVHAHATTIDAGLVITANEAAWC